MIRHGNRDTIRRMGRHVGAMSIAVAAFGLTAAACSSSPGAAPAAPGTPTASGATVSAQPTALGTILVDAQGRTVYDFANDKTSASSCTGACAANWPFVPAPASLPGVTGKLGTIVRVGGTRQLTVAGHPVYTFAGDSAPGQTNGQGKVLDGGLWTVVSPAGTPEANPVGAASQAPAGGSY